MKTMSLPHITNFAKSDEYRKKIHDLIPGGAHTYSKGDDQFPIKSPAAITHAKGVYCWDLDGNKFLDTLMGLYSVSLGQIGVLTFKPTSRNLVRTTFKCSRWSSRLVLVILRRSSR